MNKKINWLIFGFFLLVYLLLLAKNPFSVRNLIANLDPFPDTLHYLVPPLSFLKGQGFNLVREGRSLVPGVAPLYSFYLLPFLAIKNDPRMFYFGNLLLSVTSYYFFYLIAVKIIKQAKLKPLFAYCCLIIGLLLYVTNYYLYWYPTLAMAENLVLLLFLLGTYFLLLPLNTKTAILTSLIAFSFVATKYALLPLSFTYYCLIFYKIFYEKQSQKPKILIISTSIFVILLVSFFFYQKIFQQNRFYSMGRGAALPLVKQAKTAVTNKVSLRSIAPEWFSLHLVSENLPRYFSSLLGSPTRILWETQPLLPNYLAILAIFGFIFTLMDKRFRFLGLAIFIQSFSEIIFISCYQSYDYRYVYYVLPALFFGVIFFWIEIFSLIKTKTFNQKVINYSLLIIGCGVLIIYSFLNFRRIKAQIGLNLKHAETPWYYLSVLKLNENFPKAPKSGEKYPVVISGLAPYFVDLYSNKNYRLLPFDPYQDFTYENKNLVWGKNDYHDFQKLYQQYLKRGYRVYLSNFYKSNSPAVKEADQKIKNNFILSVISRGCYESCNLYELHEKNY